MENTTYEKIYEQEQIKKEEERRKKIRDMERNLCDFLYAGILISNKAEEQIENKLCENKTEEIFKKKKLKKVKNQRNQLIKINERIENKYMDYDVENKISNEIPNILKKLNQISNDNFTIKNINKESQKETRKYNEKLMRKITKDAKITKKEISKFKSLIFCNGARSYGLEKSKVYINTSEIHVSYDEEKRLSRHVHTGVYTGGFIEIDLNRAFNKYYESYVNELVAPISNLSNNIEIKMPSSEYKDMNKIIEEYDRFLGQAKISTKYSVNTGKKEIKELESLQQQQYLVELALENVSKNYKIYKKTIGKLKKYREKLDKKEKKVKDKLNKTNFNELKVEIEALQEKEREEQRIRNLMSSMSSIAYKLEMTKQKDPNNKERIKELEKQLQSFDLTNSQKFDAIRMGEDRYRNEEYEKKAIVDGMREEREKFNELNEKLEKSYYNSVKRDIEMKGGVPGDYYDAGGGEIRNANLDHDKYIRDEMKRRLEESKKNKQVYDNAKNMLDSQSPLSNNYSNDQDYSNNRRM